MGELAKTLKADRFGIRVYVRWTDSMYIGLERLDTEVPKCPDWILFSWEHPNTFSGTLLG